MGAPGRLSEAVKRSIGIASSLRRARATARPRRQISIKLSVKAPTRSGNQPPSGILCRLAETNITSIARNKLATGSNAGQGHCQTSRATIATNMEVTSMSPATAMP